MGKETDEDGWKTMTLRGVKDRFKEKEGIASSMSVVYPYRRRRLAAKDFRREESLRAELAGKKNRNTPGKIGREIVKGESPLPREVTWGVLKPRGKKKESQVRGSQRERPRMIRSNAIALSCREEEGGRRDDLAPLSA